MKITLDIETPEEMKELSDFLKRKNEKKTGTKSFSERRERLEMLFQEVKGQLPSGYSFNREELHDR